MKCRKCLTTLAWALIIAAAALASSGAATASTYEVIHQFELPKYPRGNLAMDADGNFYGTTIDGGNVTACPGAPGGCGVVWKLAPNPDGTWGTLTVLHEFTSADGAYPQAGLVFDTDGNLYGTTYQGGAYKYGGVVFKLAPNPDGTWTESVLHSFTGGADGWEPVAGLILDATGNLYGTTGGGGVLENGNRHGVVFKLTPSSDGTWTESVLHSFTGHADGGDGAYPSARLIFGEAGNLYGTTFNGGGSTACAYYFTGCGVVFKLAPNPDGTWTESVLYSFTGYADGAEPDAGLILDAAGNLYGTTYEGGYGTPGGHGHGVVFELARNPDGNWTESVLYSFTGGADGANPVAELLFDAAGNLYSTAAAGGLQNQGTVFELTPTSSGWSETVLRKFLGLAKGPVAPVIFDPKGNLYGTTSSGTGNYGVVFKITP